MNYKLYIYISKKSFIKKRPLHAKMSTKKTKELQRIKNANDYNDAIKAAIEWLVRGPTHVTSQIRT